MGQLVSGRQPGNNPESHKLSDQVLVNAVTGKVTVTTTHAGPCIQATTQGAFAFRHTYLACALTAWRMSCMSILRAFLMTLTLGQQSVNPATHASQKTKSAVYTNVKYGFRFVLPESWRGYSIVVSEWEGGDGRAYGPDDAVPPIVKGPLITVRHPLWTDEDPRQDIPIMIITKAQWRLIEEGKLSVSAAPFGPSELGRNMKYVFGLPPRFNYALITGWEEINEIIQHHPLRPLPPAK
jgi:hypothetical protein